MKQPFTFDSKHPPIHELIEEHIARRRNKIRFDRNYFESSLQKLGKTPNEIRDIIIEMDIDADIELQTDLNKLNLRLFSGIIAGIILIVMMAAFISRIVLPSVTLIFLFALIVGSLIVARKGYVQLGLIKKRREQRILKYQNWG